MTPEARAVHLAASIHGGVDIQLNEYNVRGWWQMHTPDQPQEQGVNRMQRFLSIPTLSWPCGLPHPQPSAVLDVQNESYIVVQVLAIDPCYNLVLEKNY